MREQANRSGHTLHDADTWDGFWEKRTTKGLGLVVSWVRRRFVTPKLVKYMLENTQRGTLIEAGCGEGEVTLWLSKVRGDKPVLVDKSVQALSMARQKASQLGIEVTFVHCDIKELSVHLSQAAENIVYNIGVIEHFQNCAPVLQEMDKVSGLYAIALIPERSPFWRVYIALAFKLGMVPKNFFVHLFDRTELKQMVESAGMRILWVRRLRILGIIPYLGVCFRSYS